ncbi:hypothetical protein CsSME_00016303 [Camellia sinensis var. sinensis]
MNNLWTTKRRVSHILLSVIFGLHVSLGTPWTLSSRGMSVDTVRCFLARGSGTHSLCRSL